MAFHMLFWGSPLIRVNNKYSVSGKTGVCDFVQINGLHQNTIMKGLPRHNSTLISRQNQAKFENDCILRNWHSIQLTQPIH